VQQVELTAREEWRRGWALALAAVVGMSFHTMMTASSGVFMQPIINEFHWNRTQVSSGLSVSSVLAAVLSPFFGIIIDRWGTRRLALPGLVVTGLLIASFGLMSGSIAQWFFLWAVYGVVACSIKSTVWSTSVAGAFSTSRGLALGVALSGAAVAQTIAPPITNWLITQYGWRAAYAYLGIGWGGVALLVSIPFLRDFHLEQARADGTKGYARDHLPGLSIQQAWRDTALWRIALSTFLIMLLTIGLMVHQFQILVDAGVSRANAAWLTSVFGVAGIIGKLVTGVLMDRLAPNWVGGLTLAAAAFAFMLLMEPFQTPALIVLAMFINGYASGTKLQIVGYMTTRFAGLRNFGKIFGVMAAVIAAGTGLGPVLAAWSYDSTGTYFPFLFAGVIGCLFCGLLILSLPRYPVWEKPAPNQPALA
jgi:MFS family permease